MTRASAAALLASFLAFSLELSAGKALLPRYGGSAFVWTTSLTVFQGLVLAGALYAALLSRIPDPRRRARLHLLLACAAAAAPLVPGAHAASAWPAAGVAAALLRALGAPFAILACASAVLDERTAEPRGVYAASNAGSLLALAAYPLAVEPLAPAPLQRSLWRLGYLVFLALLWSCPAELRDRERSSAEPGPARWLLLAAAPSAALLSATNALGLDLTAGPLLWAVPLAVYLATLVLAFRREPWRPRTAALAFGAAGCAWLAAFGGAALLAVLHGGRSAAPRALLFAGKLGLDLGALFLLGLSCHRALADSKPAGRSASFYAWIAAGGWAGSVLVALALPAAARRCGVFTLDWLIAALLAGASASACGRAWVWAGTGAALAAFAAGASLWTLPASARRVAALRNFYGIYTVTEEGGARDFYHGNTRHGTQRLDFARRREPTSYFSADGPVGDLFRTLGPRLKDVGVVGLGIGTLAAYARPGQRWDFYELDPDVVDLARSRFTYLADCRAPWRVFTGDARLELERRSESYDLLVLDAFHSDAMPTHLGTVEAARIYLARLAPGGVLLFHVSSRYLDLRPMFAGLAAELGLAGVWTRTAAEGRRDASTWVALAREPATLRGLRWRPLSDLRRARAWTDQHASLLTALRLF